jgi:hypothetical protein
MGLFIELYLDEDVSAIVAKMIRGRGFSIATATECGQQGKSDAEQFAYAASRHQTLLTHNRVDFERLFAEYTNGGKEHSGLIIAVRRPSHEVAARLLKILNHVAADEIKNQLRYI